MESEERSQRSIPKFSSFQAKKSAPAKDPEEPPQAFRRRNRSRTRSPRRLHKRKSHDRTEHESNFKSRSWVDDKARHSGGQQLSLASETDFRGATSLFSVDRQGDVQNLTYGSPSRSTVPEYRRVGYGGILGLPPSWRIDRQSSTANGIALTTTWTLDGRKHGNLWKKKSINSQPRHVILAPKRVDEPLNHGENFVSLTRKRKRDRSLAAGDISSVLGNGSDTDDKEIIHESSDGSESSMDEIDPVSFGVKTHHQELSRACKSEPRNLHNWLQLIDHQDAMIRLERPHDATALTASEKLALADIKVSLYLEALPHFSADKESTEVLWLGLISHGRRVWDQKKLSAQWDRAIRENPKSLRLSLKRLDFQQTSFNSFTFERCKAEFLRCLSLCSESALLASDSTAKSQAEMGLSYLLVRLTVFMRESGYHEHAIALWQAVFEFSALRPPADPDRLISDIEEFWDSEVARVGEPGYRTYKDRQNSIDDSTPDPVIIEPENVHLPRFFENLSRAEIRMSRLLAFPGRTADETGDADPFHVILFSDLQQFLTPIIKATPATSLIVNGFLCYLGLPPPQNTPSQCLAWWRDSFLASNALGWPSKAPGVTISQFTSSTFPDQLHWHPSTMDSLLLHSFESDSGWSKEHIESILNTLVSHLSTDEDLAEYYLAFIFHTDPTRLSKVAKKLIKKFQSSLRLYNVYAMSEFRLGREVSANRVFSTAIRMSKALPKTKSIDCILLWRTWLWEYLRINRRFEALRIISWLPNEELETLDNISGGPVEVASVLALKIQNILTVGRDDSLSSDRPWHAVLFSETLALYEYLYNNRSLDSALTSFQQSEAVFLKWRIDKSTYFEMLHQTKASLIEYHLEHATFFKPDPLRQHILSLTAQYPGNTVFLATLSLVESRYALNDRIRSSLSNIQLTNTPNGITESFFRIWRDLTSSVEFGSTVHSVRTAFEKAVESESGEHSVALWSLYLAFECTRGDVRHAKQVVMRGVTKLPWSKWFVILSLNCLSSSLNWDEQRSLYSALEDKELRLHMDISELLIQASEQHTSGKHS